MGLPQSRILRKALVRRLQRKERTFCYLAEATGNGSGQFGTAFTTAVSENFTTGACLVTLAESEFSGAAQLGWIVGRFHWKKRPN